MADEGGSDEEKRIAAHPKLYSATAPGSSVVEQFGAFRKMLRLSDHDLADLAEVSPSTIRRWRVKEPDPSGVPHALDNLRAIVNRMAASWNDDPRVMGRWLRSRNTGLGMQRPIQLLGDEHSFDRIAEAADAYEKGGVLSPGGSGSSSNQPIDVVAGGSTELDTPFQRKAKPKQAGGNI